MTRERAREITKKIEKEIKELHKLPPGAEAAIVLTEYDIIEKVLMEEA